MPLRPIHIGTFDASAIPPNEQQMSFAQAALSALVLATFVASIFMFCLAYGVSR